MEWTLFYQVISAILNKPPPLLKLALRLYKAPHPHPTSSVFEINKPTGGLKRIYGMGMGQKT